MKGNEVIALGELNTPYVWMRMQIITNISGFNAPGELNSCLFSFYKMKILHFVYYFYNQFKINLKEIKINFTKKRYIVTVYIYIYI